MLWVYTGRGILCAASYLFRRIMIRSVGLLKSVVTVSMCRFRHFCSCCVIVFPNIELDLSSVGMSGLFLFLFLFLLPPITFTRWEIPTYPLSKFPVSVVDTVSPALGSFFPFEVHPFSDGILEVGFRDVTLRFDSNTINRHVTGIEKDPNTLGRYYLPAVLNASTIASHKHNQHQQRKLKSQTAQRTSTQTCKNLSKQIKKENKIEMPVQVPGGEIIQSN